MQSMIKKALFLFTVFVLVVTCISNAIPPEPPVGYRWVLQEAFSDEFNGTALNTNKWHDYYPGWEGRAPARFEPKALSLKNGNLEIQSGVLDQPKGPYTIYGGGIVSKSSNAFYGYYECCFKASKIKMSTTFWLSNDKVPFSQTADERDSYSQELDIQECVGGGTVHQKFRDGMNCNTHYRYIKPGDRRETFISKGAGTTLKSEVSDEYHVYGAWWKNAEEVEFYADNKFFEMVKISKEISDKPFDRPMHVNMVTETYDWQPAPTVEEVSNPDINTSYYDWVRGYKLVPVNEKYDHPDYDARLYDAYVNITKASPNIFDTKSFAFNYDFAIDEDAQIEIRIVEGTRKKVLMQKASVPAYRGYGKGHYNLPIQFNPEEGKNYRLELALIAKDGKTIDSVRYDVSR